MASFSAPGSRWYVADLVVEIRVEGDPRNVVHVNTVLVRGSDDEDAYENAMALGRAEAELRYLNPMGRDVSFTFHGLGQLTLVYEELAHGAELFYSEQVDLAPEQVRALVRDRSELAVFAEPERGPQPDYSDGEVMAEVRRLMDPSGQN